jgi:hypothetical protein
MNGQPSANRTKPGANDIKLFYHGILLVLLSSCVIKLYYRGNYHRMAVNYHSMVNLNIIVIYCGILTQEDVAIVVNYSSKFIAFAPGPIL